MQLCDFTVGLDQPFFLIAGPCVIESEQLALDTAGELKALCERLGINFIYKSSFDKANRSSHQSYRGPGLEVGLAILEKVKQQIQVPLLTDVHEDTPLNEVAWHAAEACFTAHGGFAFAKEYHIERKWRECRLMQTAPISTNMILNYVAQNILGLPRSY